MMEGKKTMVSCAFLITSNAYGELKNSNVRTVSLRLIVAPTHCFYSVACCRK